MTEQEAPHSLQHNNPITSYKYTDTHTVHELIHPWEGDFFLYLFLTFQIWENYIFIKRILEKSDSIVVSHFYKTIKVTLEF